MNAAGTLNVGNSRCVAPDKLEFSDTSISSQ